MQLVRRFWAMAVMFLPWCDLFVFAHIATRVRILVFDMPERKSLFIYTIGQFGEGRAPGIAGTKLHAAKAPRNRTFFGLLDREEWADALLNLRHTRCHEGTVVWIACKTWCNATKRSNLLLFAGNRLTKERTKKPQGKPAAFSWHSERFPIRPPPFAAGRARRSRGFP